MKVPDLKELRLDGTLEMVDCVRIRIVDSVGL